MSGKRSTPVGTNDEVSFRRSIWDFDPRYAAPSVVPTVQDLHDIAVLQSVEAAKKRTPPAPVAGLLDAVHAIRAMSLSPQITAAEFVEVLSRIQTYGIGLKTATCMLAVVTNGAFPPMDDKVSSGLLALRKICEDEHRALNGTSQIPFALAYTGRVVPAWCEARMRGIEAQKIDAAWANAREPQASQEAPPK